MKGFLIIIVIYAISLAICSVIKLAKSSNFFNKISGENSPPKIYYVTRRKKNKEKQSVIPIKASVIEKEEIDS